MWGIIHNVIKPAAPGVTEAECSCGWHGQPAEFPEHITEIDKESRNRLTEFVDFVDEEIGGGSWGEIDAFAPDREFLTPVDFVNAMRNLGFKRIPR